MKHKFFTKLLVFFFLIIVMIPENAYGEIYNMTYKSTLKVGEGCRIEAEASTYDLAFTVSNKNVVRVVGNGDNYVILTAVGQGTSRVTCREIATGKSMSVTITVTGYIAGYEFEENTIEGISMNFIVNDDELTCRVGSNSSIKGIVSIPEYAKGMRVTAIGDRAFYGDTDLTAVNIPAGVTSLGDRCFCTCNALENVSGADNLESVGRLAFAFTKWASKLPVGLTYLGKVLYKYNGTMPDSTAINVKEGTVMIAEDAFCDYGNRLYTLTIPKSVTHIQALGSCPQSITLDPENPVYDSRNGCNAIIEKSTATLLQASNSTTEIPLSVRTIGYQAFCQYKGEITIPSNVQKIDCRAFYLSSMKTITIGSGVKEIGEEAFYIGQLKSVYSLISEPFAIDESVFTATTKDNGVLIVPEGTKDRYVATGGWNAFKKIVENYDGLIPEGERFTEKTIEGIELTYEVKDNEAKTCELVESPATINGTVTIPETAKGYKVTAIGYEVFYNRDDITAVTLPEGLKTIGRRAFSSLDNVLSITIPESVITIGTQAFEGCSSLESIIVEDDNTYYYSKEGGANCNAIIESSSNTLIAGCKNTVIPNSVTSIGNYAFYFCRLTSITIPNSVTSIGSYAFYGNQLKSVYTFIREPFDIDESVFDTTTKNNGVLIVPEGTKDRYIATEGWNAFKKIVENYDGLIPEGERFTEKTVEGIELTYEVKDCEAKTCELVESPDTIIGTVTIPETVKGYKVTAIGYKVFFSRNITAVNLPSGLKTIGKWAFSGLLNNFSINIPDGVEIIDDYAFYGCIELTSLSIPNSVTFIGESAFAYSKLESVTIPSNVTCIGSYAFSGCSHLSEVTSLIENPIAINENVFYTDYIDHTLQFTSATLYVPYGSKAKYESTEGWNKFQLIKEIEHPKVYATSIALSNASLSLTEGQEETLVATVMPDNATDKNVTWSSDNESVATVDNGKVTAIAEGNATITCTANDGSGVKATCLITVTKESSTVDLSVVETAIRTGEKGSLSINMNNVEDIIMVEFYMQLPEGITIAKDEDDYFDASLNNNRSDRTHALQVELTSDGLYHFLAYSSRNKAFSGNEGELISIAIKCDEGLEAGLYQGMMKNILLSNANKQAVNLRNRLFTVEVTDYILGDVNDDRRINGMDIVEMVDLIMSQGYSKAADLYPAEQPDGIVNGMDLVEEVDLVMSQTAEEGAAARLMTNFADGLTLTPQNDGAFALGVMTGQRYLMTQCTVQLSNGMSLEDVTTDTHHTAAWKKTGENTYMVVAYSGRNRVFASNDALLSLHCTGEGTVSVTNVLMADENRQERHFAAVSAGTTTGIGATLTNGKKMNSEKIYDLQGRRIGSKVRPGVYVVGGQKKMVK